MTDPSAGQWTLLLSLTFLLSFVVLFQIAAKSAAAFLAAPREVATLVDAVDSSISENESLGADVSKVALLEDKLRLGHLLREIQKVGDDLRQDLNDLLAGDEKRLRTRARLMWPARRVKLEEKLRRLDLLRTRFLVVYVGIVAGKAAEAAARTQQQQHQLQLQQQHQLATGSPGGGDPEKAALAHSPDGLEPPRRQLAQVLNDGIKAGRPLRSITTPAAGHQIDVTAPHRTNYAGVVRELQMSPKLHKRHTSTESSTTTRTP